jgi:hypothetical protein
MANTIIDSHLIARVRSGAGIPATAHTLELALPAATEAIKEAVANGHQLSVEDSLIFEVKNLWHQAFRAHRLDDFHTWCLEQLSAKDSLLAKFFGKKNDIHAQLADLQSFGDQVFQIRGWLKDAEQKKQNLQNKIELTEADLAKHTDEEVEKSIKIAGESYHARNGAPRDQGIFEDALAHAHEAEVMNRVLHAALVSLRDKLAAEEKKIRDWTNQLKALEKLPAGLLGSRSRHPLLLQQHSFVLLAALVSHRM